MKDEAVDVRSALERSGLDHGPISVFEKMTSMGMSPPSEASLARIFRERGIARLEPKKKPRAAFRRFVYPAPNCLWQLDATEYVLVGGRQCVIFQLQDDHSRVAVASHVARAETSEDALIVFNKGIEARGVPQRLLTDNGLALNPTRRGWSGQLVRRAKELGVQAITGKPYKPTTQGKNERFHQTLFRWLDKQPLAASINELQQLVDTFDVIYNTERPHQGLAGRMTPEQAWNATPIADPPRPQPVAAITVPGDEQHPTSTRQQEEGQCTRIVTTTGIATIRRVQFALGTDLAGLSVHATWDTTTVHFYNDIGTHIATRPWPPAGVRYSGNGKPRGPRPKQPTVTDVLTQKPSPMS